MLKTFKKVRSPIFLLLTLAYSSVWLYAVFAFSCFKGFNITDEGYYYVNFEFASEYLGNNLSLFHHFLRSLYFLVGRNIILMRFLDLSFVYLLSIFLFRVALTDKFSTALVNYFKSSRAPLLICVVLGSFSLLRFHGFLLSPSYNSLALISCLLFSIGLVFFRISVSLSFTSLYYIKRALFLDIGSSLAIGLSLFIAWIAKPTSFALLLLFILLISAYATLFFTPKITQKFFSLLLASFSCTLFLLSFFILSLYPSFSDYLADIRLSLQYQSLMQAGNASLDKFFQNIASLSWSLFPITFFAIFQLLGFEFLVFQKQWNKSFLTLIKVLFSVLALSLAIVLFSPAYSNYRVCFSILLSWLFVILTLTYRAKLFDSGPFVCLPIAGLPKSESFFLAELSLVFFFLPVAYLAGTNVGYEGKIIESFVFIVVSLLCLFQHSFSFYKTYACKSFIYSIVFPFLALNALIGAELWSPRRQDISAFGSAFPATIHSTRLYFSRHVALFYDKLKLSLRQHGFQSGDSVLDLTNGMPGVIYAVKGFPIGRPWMLSGYRGSDDFKRFALDGLGCSELTRSWIFLSARDYRHASKIFSQQGKIGLDFLRIDQYQLVFKSAVPAGYDPSNIGQNLMIFKPVKLTLIENACIEFKQ